MFFFERFNFMMLILTCYFSGLTIFRVIYFIAFYLFFLFLDLLPDAADFGHLLQCAALSTRVIFPVSVHISL